MEEEEKEAPTPSLGGKTASAPPPLPSPRHIPSLTATKKGLPRDPAGAPNPNPTPRRHRGVDPPGGWGLRWEGHSTTLRALHPTHPTPS